MPDDGVQVTGDREQSIEAAARDDRRVLTHEERTRVEAERRAEILALPQWTLMRLGWVTNAETRRVQGSVRYRIGDGLGPTGRDTSARQVLDREVQGSHMPWLSQEWGIEILATPASGLVERVSFLEAALAKAQAMKVALLDEFGAHALSDATLDAVLTFEVVYRGLRSIKKSTRRGLADETAAGEE